MTEYLAKSLISLRDLCLTSMTYYIYKDANNQWRWYLKAGNDRRIANSGEGYHNKQDCLSAIALVKGSSDAPVYDISYTKLKTKTESYHLALVFMAGAIFIPLIMEKQGRRARGRQRSGLLAHSPLPHPS